MNSDNLTIDQARKIGDAIGATLGYLSRLKDRMYRTNFPYDDKLLKLVEQAHDAMHSLNIDLQYRSCLSGVGQKAR